MKNFVEVGKTGEDKKIKTVDDLNEVLDKLLGDKLYKLYFNSPEEEIDHRKKWALQGHYISEKRSLLDDEVPCGSYERARDYIMRDLFIWAVLMNHVDMAKVLLAHMNYRICAALIATKILKVYYKKAAYGELKTGFHTSAQYFEQYAISCLDKCDNYDRDRACEVILQQNEVYGFVSCLQVNRRHMCA